MWSLRKSPNMQEEARDAATERLLRSHKARFSDADLRASVAGAWRRIDHARFRRPPARAPKAGLLLHRLLVPSLALLCFLCGLWIGVSLQLDDVYGSVMSDLASHPLLAEVAP